MKKSKQIIVVFLKKSKEIGWKEEHESGEWKRMRCSRWSCTEYLRFSEQSKRENLTFVAQICVLTQKNKVKYGF